ncbi:hypothetical protein [Gemmobacter sp. 24YEA27]|uniref:hypothetical protein n=1 Tax=Gemmobacter sp. 24YEA27 TaxID=3040672 RepID=UPI0024B32077|nr:hypothetical protein [Gemmobacter sp. 24YEA27]
MSNSVIPFPGSDPERVSEEEDPIRAAIRAASQELLSAVMAQPVPDRLHALAAEVGRALDQRAADFSSVQGAATDDTA